MEPIQPSECAPTLHDFYICGKHRTQCEYNARRNIRQFMLCLSVRVNVFARMLRKHSCERTHTNITQSFDGKPKIVNLKFRIVLSYINSDRSYAKTGDCMTFDTSSRIPCIISDKQWIQSLNRCNTQQDLILGVCEWRQIHRAGFYRMQIKRNKMFTINLRNVLIWIKRTR